VFWTEATELEDGNVKLQATGMVGTGRAVLSVVARRGQEDVAALGVFSGGAVALSAGSVLDAYDSSKGTYASQTDKEGAALGSNDDISLTGTTKKPSKVKGDVTAGPGKTVSLLGMATVTGFNGKSLSQTELPPIEVPELTLGEPQVQGSPYPLVIPAGSAGYQSLTVNSGSQAIIQGPAQVVLGKLELQAGGELVFDTQNGAVELYVTDALDAAATAKLTNTSTLPQDVLILVPGQTALPVALRATGPFHGVVYAPEASVVVGGAFELFGALVTNALTAEGGVKLHFDRHLAALSAESVLPKLLSWRIVELGNTSTDLSADPFDLLDLDRNVLPVPAKAHMDQELVIDYYDFSNVYHRYIGLESQFDWSVVQSVVSATRDEAQVIFPRAPFHKYGTIKQPAEVPVMDGPMI